MGASCLENNKQFIIKNFYDRNKYTPHSKGTLTNYQRDILNAIAPYNKEQKKYVELAKYIDECPKRQFVDVNFSELEALPDKQKKAIHFLFNYQQRRIKELYQQAQTPFQNFCQEELQFTYLSSVINFICHSKKLKEQIFVTKSVNKYNAYIVKLFSNGEPSQFFIDDFVPTQKSKIKYSTLEDGRQIWPLLLQKAWCKAIGGYDKAKGLSPEDCFEQITGIPAQSFELNFIQDLQKKIDEGVRNTSWIALTAKVFHESEETDVKTKQVYLLKGEESFERDSEISYSIMSAFDQKKHKMNTGILGHSRFYNGESNRLEESRRISDIKNKFSYLTLGHNRNTYQPYSIQFNSKKADSVIFDLKVLKESEINIRVIQFYEEYLDPLEKVNYKYSPVLMELYCKDDGLVQNAQNYNMPMRSSNLSQKIFVKLNKGQYYLRVMIDWENQEFVNSANLVVYAQKQSYQIQKKDYNESKCLQLFKMAFEKGLQTKNRASDKEKLQISCLPKNSTYLLRIKNINDKGTRIRIFFKELQNLKLIHNQYILQKNKIDVIELSGWEQKILEFVPIDYEEEFVMSSCYVQKI